MNTCIYWEVSVSCRMTGILRLTKDSMNSCLSMLQFTRSIWNRKVDILKKVSRGWVGIFYEYYFASQQQGSVHYKPSLDYCRQGPYAERIDLCFEPFFVKEIRHVIEWLREIKTADQHCYKFLLIQQNKLFRLNVN